MKISIITVVFNNEQTIECAIKSVLAQSYKNLEYIIVDGGSTDNTLKIINAYKSSIGKIISERDTGIYDAMNKGVFAASGDVIGILNSDDLYADNEVISDIMKQFNDDPELDILYGNLFYVKRNFTDKVVRKWRSKPYYPSFFENANVPPHPALFIKKRVYKDAGKFDLEYKLASDYEFMLRIFKKHTFKSKYLNRLIVRMRLGGATNKNIKNIINGNKEILAAWLNNGFSPPFYFMPLRILKRLIQFF